MIEQYHYDFNQLIIRLLDLLDLLRNECRHLKHIQCTNALTSYILKTHTEDEINIKPKTYVTRAENSR